MSRRADHKSFWRTIPGIVSAAAGFLGALAAILGILTSLGWIGDSGDSTKATSDELVDRVRLVYGYAAYRHFTEFPYLDMKFVPGDSTIAFSCRGTCSRLPAQRHVRVPATKVALIGGDVRIEAGSTLTVTFRNQQVGTKIWSYTARPRTAVVVDVSCVRPPQTVPSAC
jgi:hypothetical protein